MSLFARRAVAPARGRVEPYLAVVPVRRVDISPVAVAQASVRQKPGVTYVLPTTPPGVVPEDAKTMAQDDAISDAYAYASQGIYSEGLGFPGFAYLAELAQRPEYRRMSEVIAKEMTRKWVRLVATGGEKKDDRLKLLDAAMKRYGVQDVFRRVAEHDGFFGRGQIYVDTGAGENPDELMTPLLIDKAKIGRGDLKRLTVIEPIWTYPAQYNSTDPLRRDYYRPQSWYVMGKRIHASRLMTFISREMPDILKPAYSFAGLSLSQMAKPYIDNWIRTRQSVSDLLHSFSVSGILTDMSTYLAAGAKTDMQTRLDYFNANRDNQGAMLLDKETEEYFNISTPLGTLDALQAQAQEQQSSVSAIPLVKLLGITPSGLNASSDGEVRSFYDEIESRQEHLFTAHLTRVMQIIQLSEFGEIDSDIGFVFEPLWQMDEAARATIRKTNADSASIYIDAGVLAPEDERRRLAAEDGGVYNGLDPDDMPEVPDAGGVPGGTEAG